MIFKLFILLFCVALQWMLKKIFYWTTFPLSFTKLEFLKVLMHKYVTMYCIHNVHLILIINRNTCCLFNLLSAQYFCVILLTHFLNRGFFFVVICNFGLNFAGGYGGLVVSRLAFHLRVRLPPLPCVRGAYMFPLCFRSPLLALQSTDVL